MLLENETTMAVTAFRGYERWTNTALIEKIRFDLNQTP